MPWKNGQGTTHEIALCTDPDDGPSGTFVWRLSIAAVDLASPFSRFPHIDRTILLLSGAGMVLDSGPHGRHVLAQPFAPYAFAGDWTTDCTLIDGPCRDFNVMVDRRRATACVTVLPLDAERGATWPVPVCDAWALFALDADLRIAASGDPADGTSSDTAPWPLPVGATLLGQDDDGVACPRALHVRSAGGTPHAHALAITFARHVPAASDPA